MGRGLVAALLAWSAIVLTWAVFAHGGQIPACLGPIGVTEASCHAALGHPPLTGLDHLLRGPALVAIVHLMGATVIVLVARAVRQRGGL